MHVAVCAYEPEQRVGTEKRTAKTRLADFKGRPHIPKAELKYAAGMSFRCPRLLALVGGYRKESSGTKRELRILKTVGSWTCKPNFVCREAPPCGDHVPQDGHSSRPRIAARLKRPTRRFGAPSRHTPGRSLHSEPELPPYLVLLRVGFALPAPLLERRCALAAPFHPYPDVAARAVFFLWHFPSIGLDADFPDVIRHTALWSSDFPPSSLDAARAAVRSSCLHSYYIR